LTKDIQETAARLGIDRDNYLRLIAPIVQDWNAILPDILAPFHFPKNPIKYSQFGLKALWSASHISKRFETSEAKALWAGMALMPFSHSKT
jgi:phytoene dehydrogenase-like protein